MKRSVTPKKQIDVSVDEFKSRIKMTDLNTYFIFGSILLVLFIGLYAIFSPEAQNARLSNPACGKIVVASNGPSMNSNVASDLLTADYFLVVNPLSNKLLSSVRNPYINDPQAQNDLAYLVAGKGEEAVIAGFIPPQTDSILTQFGVKSYGGYAGKVNNAVNLYRQARLATDYTAPKAPVQQVAFGTPGRRAFVCPRCNWRFQSENNGNSVPFCPNCGASMAGDFNPQNQQNLLTQNIFDIGAGIQNNVTTQFNPPVFSTRQGTGLVANPVALTNATLAPPIPADAQMPHAYRGVCTNCHQILAPNKNLNPQANNAAMPVAFGRPCVLR